jgi:hypothetical protein
MATSKIKSDSIDTIAATKLTGTITPADATVTSAKLVDGAILNADVNASAAIEGGKLDLNTGTGNAKLTSSSQATTTLILEQATGAATTPSSGVVLQLQRDDTTGRSAELSILSGNVGQAQINFGDAQDEDIGNITYDNNTNGMLFKTNTSTAMNISSDGEVTKPLQPVYSGYDAAGTQLNTTGASTLYTLKQRSEFYDIGGNHDLTSTYTAPITGKYLVIANQGVSGITTAADYFQIKIRTSNRIYNISYFYTTANWPWSECCVSGSVIADMDAGDTCYLTILGIGESGNVWDPTSSGENSNFMVYLLT